MIFLKIALCAVLLLQPSSTRWKPFSALSKVTLSYDLTRVKKVNNTISVWIKIEPSIDTLEDVRLRFAREYRNAKFINFTHIIQSWEYDCAAKRVRTTGFYYYGGQDVIDSKVFDSAKWEAVIPESSGEILMDILCNKPTDK